MSLPFVHTARRTYRLNGPVKTKDIDQISQLIASLTTKENFFKPYHLEEGEVADRKSVV